MRIVERGDAKAVAAATACYAAARTFILFVDGYAFTLSALLAAALWLWWLALGARRGGHACWAPPSRWGTGHRGGRLSLVRTADRGARSYRRVPSYGTRHRDARVAHADVWSADALGLASDHTGLWGDGTNSSYNYVGVLCAALAGAGVVAKWRQPYVLALAGAALVALVLSFGPALKADDIRGPFPARPTPASYMMPANAATLELPWDRVYRVPGGRR